MNEENAEVLAKSTAPGCRGSERCRGSGRTWGRGSEITIGCRSILVPSSLRPLVPLVNDFRETFTRGSHVIYVEHDQSVQFRIFCLSPFGTAGALVAFQRLLALGYESSREHPCWKLSLQLSFLIMQFCLHLFVRGRLHLGGDGTDFLDVIGEEGIVYRLVEVFPCCWNAVRMSFLFVVKHRFKGCAIIV